MTVLIAEVDRAFKQFVFECMDLSKTDEVGHVMFRQHKQCDIPWDDPYPYYKVTKNSEILIVHWTRVCG